MNALDGPAAGVTLSLRSCPVFLRLVRSEITGKWDALDQPGDTPSDNEDVFAYRVVPGTWGQVFVRPGGRYEYGDYKHLEGYDAELIRDRDKWREWVNETFPDVKAQFDARFEEAASQP